ncbi:MAG: hypothetical protein M1834_001813 [Cirrosporium novae-zelandiae]|nr:MAG: hypothetical protein M1834_001813 [Cirrosporium novae-zelandiae]
MPPFRIPFTSKRPNTLDNPTSDENARPPQSPEDGFEKVDTHDSRSSAGLNIPRNKEQPNEYKLGIVNDSGVFLPPSPPEKRSFWHRSNNSTTSSNHRSLLNENEPFSISRESFESYRRSFDISARSPVLPAEPTPPRSSLDSRQNRLPRSAFNGTSRFQRPAPTDEDTFEDVGLNDDAKPKKRSIFARFGDSVTSETPSHDNSRPNSSHHTFHLPGRKRGMSGGQELGSMPKPESQQGQEGVVQS